MKCLRTPRRLRATCIGVSLLTVVLTACGAENDDATEREEAPDDESVEDEDGNGDEAAGADDAFPENEVTFIMPFPAGSAPDGTYREITSRVEDELGVSVVVVNREGAGGTVGLGELASAEPDGYTIGMGSTGPLMVQPLFVDTEYEGPQDFEPIIQTDAAPMVLFSNADTGIEDIDGFIETAKADPGSLRVGLIERSVLHAEAQLLMNQADIDLNIVPYDAGEQVTAVLEGTVEAGVAQPAVVMQHEEAGTVNILGVFGTERPEGLDAPLFQEEGYDIPYIVFETVLAPAGTPSDRIEILHDAFRTAIEDEEMQDYLAERMVLPLYLGTEDLRERLERDVEVYGELAEQMQ